MPRRKRTPEQQDYVIQQVTSSMGPIRKPGVARLLLGEPKVKPYLCEHCESVMSKTGRLPAMNDRYSWAHWIGWSVGEYGVQKVHSLGLDSSYGQCCVDCFKVFQQWHKEHESEGGNNEDGL